MPRRRSTGPTRRDLLGNAGKGDKSRVTNHKAFLANLAEVKLTGKVEGLERKGAKLVKIYGKPAPPTAVQLSLPAIFVH